GAAWLLAVGIYGLAKLAEFYDGAIYAATGGLGGHTLKHFLGAGAVYVLFRMVQTRRELP
ncbi:MAG: alkaline phytoceramidase, partial [SAR324 cluster bacterium]|nr:alkaline phytoceramidase [SAR324 cluster bacterium]